MSPKDDHSNNLYQVLGVKNQENFLGDTGREPHSYIPVHKLTDGRTNKIVGVKGDPFAIASGSTIKIKVADEDGANDQERTITFDSPAFADGIATAEEVDYRT